MSTTKPTFAKLDLDKAFAVVDQFAANHNVPDLQFPDQGSKTAEVVSIQTTAQLSEIKSERAISTPPVKNGAKRPIKKAATQEEEGPLTRRMTLDLPTYLFSAIARRGFDQGACAKYVILQALQTDGFEVKPEDMTKDGRRTKKELRHVQ